MSSPAESRRAQLDEIVALLGRTPGALAALLDGLPDALARATEGEGTWSPYDVVVHLALAERTNWVARARHILAGSGEPFPPFERVEEPEPGAEPSLADVLATFAERRRESLAALADMRLTPDDLAREGVHPTFGVVTLGQLLSTWAAHDMDHLGQIARVIAKSYETAVGPWSAFLSILRDRRPGGRE